MNKNPQPRDMKKKNLDLPQKTINQFSNHGTFCIVYISMFYLLLAVSLLMLKVFVFLIVTNRSISLKLIYMFNHSMLRNIFLRMNISIQYLYSVGYAFCLTVRHLSVKLCNLS